MKIFGLSEFANLVGCKPQTLQVWDRKGKLVAHRNFSGRRYYTEDDYTKVTGMKYDERENKK